MSTYPGFIHGDYTARSLRANSERTINLYPEMVEDGLGNSKAALVSTPGLTLWLTAGAGPVWDMFVDPTYARIYFLSGPATAPHLYLAAYGTPWTVTDLGAVPFVTSATTFHHTAPFLVANQSQLLIAGGQIEGATYPRVGVGGLATLDSGTAGQGGWPGRTTSGCFIDGYMIVNSPGPSVWTNQFFISKLNDATQWSALDFAQEGDGADAIMGVAALRRDLWLFGAKRTVVYYDSGSADFPFSRIPGAVLQISCVSPASIREVQGSLIFLGAEGPSDVGAPGVGSATVPSVGTSVYRTQGYNAVRISTHSVEKIIASWPDPANAKAFVYADAGHTFYVLNGASGAAIVYDVTTKQWHERISNLGTAGNYDPQCYAHFNNMHLVGSATSGKIYQMDTSIYTDTGNPITRTRIGPPLVSENRFNMFHRFTLDLEVGTQASGAQNLTLAWSNDGGQSFPMSKTIAIGGVGLYSTRAVWNRLGKGRDRVFKVTTTDPMQIALIAAYLDFTAGSA